VGRAGDQSFLGIGIPSLWMSLSEQPASADATAAAFAQLVGSSRGGGLGWWWHTTEDTVDKIDPELLLRDTRIYVLAIASLLSTPLLPLQAGPEAREFYELLRAKAEEAGDQLDLGPAVERAAAVLEAAELLDRWAAQHGAEANDAQTAAHNAAVLSVIRGLTPYNYTAAGRFDHDPALAVPPLPLLAGTSRLAALPPDSDEAKFLKVGLVRARNEIVWALEQILAELQASEPAAGE